MKDRVAIIDMGTNTFHLLVADIDRHQREIVYEEKYVTKIGKGGINNGQITEEGIARALNTLKKFKQTIDDLNTKRILAFGTSAFRNARNGQEIVRQISEETGILSRIISGDEEAELIYLGVRSALKLGTEKSLIIDIGGGSVEFIVANEKEIFWKQSLEIGGQRLLEKFHRHDPILPREINELDNYFDEVLKPVFASLEQLKPTTLVGSSGTFDTLSDIFCFRQNIAHPHTPETPLTLEGFYEIYNELIVKDRASRMKMQGMIEMRVDMIVVGCCIVRFLLEHYRFQNIRVSSYSLKEGVLASLSE